MWGCGKVVVSHSYKQLLVWQKAKSFAVQIYRATETFPGRERYGLTTQIRRAAVSVSSNIAEGQGRLTKGEFRQFLGQARGSVLELATQLAISHDLGYLIAADFTQFEAQCDEILRMLNGLIASLQATPANNSTVNANSRNSKLETRN